jgi:outer membrane lipoprotein LolB
MTLTGVRQWRLLLLLAVSACASAPPGTADQSIGQGRVQAFTLSGRLAIRQARHSELLRLDWVHAPDRERLSLSSPLGSQVMLLEETVGHARLSLPDRDPIDATDDSQLMQSLLGYVLPVRGLADWVTGQLPAEAAVRSEGSGDQYTLHFVDQGWTGTLQRWRSLGGGAVPGLIVVAREDLQLRLVVDYWNLTRGEP